MKINGKNLVNDWLEGNGRFKTDPQIATTGGTWETNGASNKKKGFVFYGKNETEEVSAHVTLAVDYLPVIKFTAVMPSEKLCNLL